MDSSQIDPTDRDYLIRTVIGEAGNQPFDGKVGVAAVVLNRLNSGGYGDSIPGVVLAPKQFEPWSTRRGELLNYAPDKTPGWGDAAKAVDAALSGNDPTNGATHFANVATVAQRGDPAGRQGGWLTKMDNVTQIGAHTFGNADAGRRGGGQAKAKPLDLSDLDKLYGASPAQAGGASQSAPDVDLGSLDKLYGGSQPALATATAQGAPAPAGGAPGPMAITVKPSGVLDNAPPDADGAPGDGVLAASAKNVGTGLVKGVGDAAGIVGGVKGLADYLLARGASAANGKPVDQVLAQQQANQASMEANATPIGKLAAAINPLNYLPTSDSVNNRLLALTGEYKPSSELGKLAQTGARVVTGSLGPGSVAAKINPATALPEAVPNLLTNAVKNAPVMGTSGAVGQYAAETTGDPLVGMAGWGSRSGCSGRDEGCREQLVGTIDPARAALGAKARAMGIPLDVGDLSDSRFVRMLSSTVKDLPMNGSGPAQAAKQTGINRAVAQTFGESADRITPDVMARARDRLGNTFESFGSKVPQIAADAPMVQGLQDALHEVNLSGFDDGAKQAAANLVSDVLAKVDPTTNSIAGSQWRDLTSSKSILSKVAANPKSPIQDFANNIKDVLNGAIERSAPPDVLAEIQSARKQWGNMRTVEPLVAKAQGGDITPTLLQGRVNAKSKGTYGTAYGGGGDLNEVAQMGQMMREPPNSGTAPRMNLLNALSSGAGAAGAIAFGNPLVALAPVATMFGQAAAGRLIGSALRGDTMAQNLIARSLGQSAGQANKLLNLAAPTFTQSNLLTGVPQGR
jgi:hypothetical protein